MRLVAGAFIISCLGMAKNMHITKLP
jgi:hypothetical protein